MGTTVDLEELSEGVAALDCVTSLLSQNEDLHAVDGLELSALLRIVMRHIRKAAGLRDP